MSADRTATASSCGYARSKLLGLFAFLDISKADAGVLYGALSYVDEHSSERVHIDEFCRAFCPATREVLLILWSKYTWERPTRAFRTSVVHIDEDDEDALDQLAVEEEDLQGAKVKEQHQKEKAEQHQKKTQERLYPSYLQFLSFLLVFMTTSDKTLPRWLYWLWFHIPSLKPSKESLLQMVSEIWPKQHQFREQYGIQVRKGIQVVDAGFDAVTFGIYNSKCGGAYTRPALELKREIYKTLAPEALWHRVSESMLRSLSDLSTSMFRLEDRKLKGTPELFATKGERKQTRKEIRRFLARYLHFTTMKVNEEKMESKGGFFLPLIRSALSATATAISKSSRAALGNSSAELSKSDFVRNLQISRKLTGYHARRKQEEEEKRSAKYHEGEHHIPLEWKYRKQVQWPQERLQNKADETRKNTIEMIARAIDEVVPASRILKVNLGDESDDGKSPQSSPEKTPDASPKHQASDVDEDDEDDED